MKNIVIIGASGFVGTAVLKEAISRGYQVKALVRNPEKVEVKDSAIEVIKTDVMDTASLTDLLKGTETVISAYNPGWTNPNIYDDTLKGYPSIINAAKGAGVKRLLIVGGAGSLLVAPNTRVMDTGVLPEEILPGVKSLAKILTDYLQPEKDIDWVFFSPAGNIFPGERTGKFRLGKDNLIVDTEGKSNISVQDYAVAMIDELETPKHHQERFTIGY
ncbi:NAD(P)-dependent oxidoreductase [Dysgonomonas macrotermitis]|uniref:NAD(P)-binding domain-containing protein n=1 Tax=Dysgonomonas macrotermitis TaxID=1346286 RepID=A0A1M4WW17_9BACT|nr:NAD(P)-dependent oxidoreductase [Dysgonomonas macrotermitis]SHE85172.1 hypothetical protein SAMN05444362_102327 [Dysgonomonas macrotermitis]